MQQFPWELRDLVHIDESFLEKIEYNFNSYEQNTLDNFLEDYSEYPMRVYGGATDGGERQMYPFKQEVDFSFFDIGDNKYNLKLFFGIMHIAEEFGINNYDIGLLVSHPDKFVYLYSNLMQNDIIKEDKIRMITKYYDLYRKIKWS